jgi:hypothetical protein
VARTGAPLSGVRALSRARGQGGEFYMSMEVVDAPVAYGAGGPEGPGGFPGDAPVGAISGPPGVMLCLHRFGARNDAAGMAEEHADG